MGKTAPENPKNLSLVKTLNSAHVYGFSVFSVVSVVNVALYG